MEAVRQSWTDDRLDDRFDHLEGEMGQRFSRVEGEIKTLRSELKESNAELRSEMRETRAGMQAQMGVLNRTLLQVGGGMLAALFGILVAIAGFAIALL